MSGGRLARVDRPGSRPPPRRQGYLVRGSIPPAFVEAGALSPADAIPFTPDPSHSREWERLRRDRAIRQADGGWWLDIVAYQAAARARSRAALPWLVLGAVLIALLATSFYRG